MATANRMVESVESYKTYLIRSGKKASAKNYGIALYNFNQWLLENTPNNIDGFVANEFAEFLSGFKMARTANMHKSALRGYLKYRAGSMRTNDPDFMFVQQLSAQINLAKIRPQARSFDKVALTRDECVKFVNNIIASSLPELAINLTVLEAYFGARPIELEYHLKNAKIDWNDNSMVLQTAKTLNPRWLPWESRITPYLKDSLEILKTIPPKNPGEYVTKVLGAYQKTEKGARASIPGITITAKTFRKTFQTEMRVTGVKEIYIDSVLGHTTKNIGDHYMDFSSSSFKEGVRKMMVDDHYLLHGILL